jgi:hypothetical protein
MSLAIAPSISEFGGSGTQLTLTVKLSDDPVLFQYLKQLFDDRKRRRAKGMAKHYVFLDESYHNQPPIYAVGGYLVREDHVAVMTDSWRAALADFGVPYFHMVDVAHGNMPFDKLSKAQRTEIATRMIELIKMHVSRGLVAMANPKCLNRAGRGPHHFCVAECFVGLGGPVARHHEDKVEYLIEENIENQTRTLNAIRGSIESAEYEPGKEPFQRAYDGMSFRGKAEVPLLQAADLLVWQATKFLKDKLTKVRGPRGDFRSLMEQRHLLTYVHSPDFFVRMPDGREQEQWLDEAPFDDDPMRDFFMRSLFLSEIVDEPRQQQPGQFTYTRKASPPADTEAELAFDVAVVNQAELVPEPEILKPCRIDPCPCGSGLRYKNCHGVI